MTVAAMLLLNVFTGTQTTFDTSPILWHGMYVKVTRYQLCFGESGILLPRGTPPPKKNNMGTICQVINSVESHSHTSLRFFKIYLGICNERHCLDWCKTHAVGHGVV